MRVAYDVSPMLRARVGIGHYTAALLESMRQVDSGTTFQLYALALRQQTAIPPQESTVRRWKLPARLTTSWWSALGFPNGRLLTGDSDVVHGTNFWVPPLPNKKGVVTVHDLAFKLLPETCTPQIQRYSWILPKVLKTVGAVITPSQTVKDELVTSFRFPADRVVVALHGIRNAFVDARPDSSLEKRLSITSPYVLFAGTQEPRKNLDRLIDAFRTLEETDLQLVIAGPPGWGSIDLPGVVRKLHLEDRIVFSGYLSDLDLGALMAGSRAFVFPTLYEGFGLPPLEAMAAGVPVVASRAGSLPEVLGDVPFWCDPLDPVSIANAIALAVKDSPGRTRSIQAGRLHAATFTWKRSAIKTLEAYRSVVG